MTLLTGQESRFDGPHGHAEAVHFPADDPRAAETLCAWLLTQPSAHPAWSQYNLFVVRLRDNVPGFPPPKRKFPGATHELLLLALDPDHGPYTPENMSRFNDGSLPYLTPVSVVEQTQATDEEMKLIAAYCARAVTQGWLWPETADAPTAVRQQWHNSVISTLDHLRHGHG